MFLEGLGTNLAILERKDEVRDLVTPLYSSSTPTSTSTTSYDGEISEDTEMSFAGTEATTRVQGLDCFSVEFF